MKKILIWGFTGTLGGLLLFSHVWGGIRIGQQKEFHLGNNDENIARIAPPAEEGYRFAVMGDPENGLDVFNACLKKAKEDGCRFIVIVGDLVAKATEARYRYFLCRSAAAGYDPPIFAAIGNEDIPRFRDLSYGTKDLFHHYVGPEDWFFRYDDALFIMLDNCIKDPTSDQLAWLEGVLQKNRSGVCHAFLFTHRPLVPFKKGDPNISIENPDCPELHALIRRHSVTPFAGHLHSYRKYAVDGATHIVTGGAGGTLQEPQAFYHYVEVDVRGNTVKDTTVRVDDVSSPREIIERIVVSDFFFFLQAHSWLYAILGLLLGTGTMLGLRRPPPPNKDLPNGGSPPAMNNPG